MGTAKMTKGAALQQFFEGFGMPAHPSASVPEDAALPYLTYELATSAWGGEPVSLSVDLWYYTESEAVPNAKADELSEAIGSSGKTLPCGGGYIWLKRGSPWCRALKDEASPEIKRRHINVTAEYLTLH